MYLCACARKHYDKICPAAKYYTINNLQRVFYCIDLKLHAYPRIYIYIYMHIYSMHINWWAWNNRFPKVTWSHIHALDKRHDAVLTSSTTMLHSFMASLSRFYDAVFAWCVGSAIFTAPHVGEFYDFLVSISDVLECAFAEFMTTSRTYTLVVVVICGIFSRSIIVVWHDALG